MSKHRHTAHEEEEEGWLLSYADMITLLVCFFVLLLSAMEPKKPKMEELLAGIRDKLGGTTDSQRPIFSLMNQLQQTLADSVAAENNANHIGFDDQGVAMEFASGSFFEPGSVELTNDAKLILSRIKQELEVPPFDLFLIDIEGHTDDTQVSTPYYPSNWELSSARAARVVRYFIELGLNPAWMKASGFADTHPLVPNRTIDGKPIPENQAKNRRITIRLHP